MQNPKIISNSIISSLIIISIGAFIYLFNLPIKNILLSSSLKYIFFLRNPNQLAILAITYFSIYLIIKSQNSEKIDFINLILPSLFLNIILSTASRTGFVVGFLCILLFYFIYLKLFLKRRNYSRFLYKLIISVLLVFLIFILHRKVVKTWTSERAASVVNTIKKGEYSDDIRKILNKKAIKVLKKHSILGIGLGNFKKQYAENEIHNSYLSILTETGILGFSGFVGVIIYLFYILFKYKTKNILEFLGILGCIFLYFI